MRFVERYNFMLLTVGKFNGLNLSEEVVKNSIYNGGFDGSPIVFNKNKSFKKHSNNKELNKHIENNCVGVVVPNTVRYCEGKVIANVLLREDFADRGNFDNWAIDYDKTEKDFIYTCCEIY